MVPNCTAMGGVLEAECVIEAGTGELIIHLKELEEGGEVGNYRVNVSRLFNPPSRRGSSIFPVHDFDNFIPGIYLTTKNGIGEQVAYFPKEVFVENDYAAEL